MAEKPYEHREEKITILGEPLAEYGIASSYSGLHMLPEYERASYTHSHKPMDCDDYDYEEEDEMEDFPMPKQSDEPFEVRYERAKRFAQHFYSPEEYKELEAVDFYIDKPFPLQVIRTQEELDKMLDECEREIENEEVYTAEEVEKMFAKYKTLAKYESIQDYLDKECS